MQYPAGRIFARNRSISYGFRDIHTFSFSAKIQDGRQKWRKLKFLPFAWDTLAIPCGSKIRSKSLYLLRFSRYSHFFIFRKNPRWPPKVAKIEIFPLCMGHSSNTLRVENSLEIALSHGFRDIHTFSFSAKFQDGHQKWRKLNFFAFAWDTLAMHRGSKIRSKSLDLLRFSRYSHFFIFCKNPRWPPKVAKIEIFALCMEHSCNTLRVENSLKITLSLTVFDIFVIFHIFTKSSNKIVITHLYIEQQL